MVQLSKSQQVRILSNRDTLFSYTDTVELRAECDIGFEQFSSLQWYYKTKKNLANEENIILLASDVTSLKVNKAGVYVFRYTYNNNNYEVEKKISSNICQNPVLEVKINDSFYTNNYTTNDSTIKIEVKILEHRQKQTPDLDDYVFNWYVKADTVFESGQGLNIFEKKFPFEGKKVIILSLVDKEGCAYLSTFTPIIVPKSDTFLISNAVPDANQMIVLNINQIPTFILKVYKGNEFRKSVKKIIFPSNSVWDTLRITNSLFANLQDRKDIVVYAKLSFGSNAKINVVNPQNYVAFLQTTFNSNNYYFWGKPNYNYQLIPKNTNQYFYFSSFFKNFQTIKVPYFEFSDGQVLFDSSKEIYLVPGGFYYFNFSELVNKKINGRWEINFLIDILNGSYGFLEEIGIILNQNYYLYQLKPKTLECTDSWGRKLSVNGDYLSIPHVGISEYLIKCNAIYDFDGFEYNVDKHLVVKTPQRENIYYFTPNGDGVNDFWRPVSYLDKCDIFIFNKNGQLVAHLTNENMYMGWDGTYNNKPLPSDSYGFIIKFNNGQLVSGIVNILR